MLGVTNILVLAAVLLINEVMSSPTSPANVMVESVTSLACTADGMKIRVNLTELGWLYNDTDPASISLADERCIGSVIGDTWVLDNPHSQCYTQRTIDDSFVRYKNALIYKEHGTGPIVREHRWRVDLQCNFYRHMQVNENIALSHNQQYETILRSDFSATMRLYNDSSLRHQSVKAELGDNLYMYVELHGLWNVSMHLRRCVARPSPGSDTSYTLIDNGCAIDAQTYIVFETHNATLFHFKAFEFYSGISTVYIDCDVTYCALSDTSSRCTADCN